MKKTLILSLALMALLNILDYAMSPTRGAQGFMSHWGTQVMGAAATPQPARAAAILSARDDAAATPTPTETAEAGAPADPTQLAASKLKTAGLKPEHAALYLRVQAATGTPWQLLAAVHRIETGQRGDTAVTSYAGAQGPMQFMPATFRAYSLDGDGDGDKQITDLEDAMMSAGRYLAANGAARGDYHNALYHYNHSNSYVSQVLTTARKLGL